MPRRMAYDGHAKTCFNMTGNRLTQQEFQKNIKNDIPSPNKKRIEGSYF